MRSAELANAQGAPTAAKQFVERALELLPADDLELRWRALLERHAALLRLSDPEALKVDSEALDALAQKLAQTGRGRLPQVAMGAIWASTEWGAYPQKPIWPVPRFLAQSGTS
ncbi:MAG: hypothetical protein C4332_09370 [Meiothermus sp.]